MYPGGMRTSWGSGNMTPLEDPLDGLTNQFRTWVPKVKIGCPSFALDKGVLRGTFINLFVRLKHFQVFFIVIFRH